MRIQGTMKTSSLDQFLSAIDHGDVATIRKLLKLGTPKPSAEFLQYASKLGSVEVVKELLDFGHSRFIDEFDDMSMSPLMWAATKDRVPVALLLLSAGADVNAFEKSKAGNTAIKEAADSGTPEMVQLLLQAGADPHIRGWMQLSAIDVAEERVRREDSAQSKAVLRLLREKTIRSSS